VTRFGKGGQARAWGGAGQGAQGFQSFGTERLCVDCGHQFTSPPDKSYLVRCFGCYKKWNDYCKAYDPTTGGSLPAKTAMLGDHGLIKNKRRLIQLCHPDKHNGSEAAKEITQWLLSLPD
jgi:hypothetical protein